MENKEQKKDKPKPRKKKIIGVAKKPYKKKEQSILPILSLILIVLLAIFISAPVKAKNDFTILVYMCGSDLESAYGMATMDLIEMTNADISENVNLLVYTGGTTSWRNEFVRSGVHSIYKVEHRSLNLLTTFPTKSMGNPSSLEEFLLYAKLNYPSSRYGLIFWDHGGGAFYGFGSDTENYARDSLSLQEIRQVLENGYIYFDFIGFDACLMGTVEAGISLEGLAGFLIASEEVEPGTGWYYTDFLSAVSRWNSLSTEQIGKLIIDGYISSLEYSRDNINYTLSLINLNKIKNINKINYKNKSINKIISETKTFSVTSPVGEIDLIDFLNRSDISEAKVREAIVYERHVGADDGTNGLSVCYFEDAPFSLFTKEEEPDNDITFDLTWHYNKEGMPYLILSDSDYEYITSIERILKVKFDDEYVSLGSDNTYAYDENGYLVADLDPTWLTIDGWPAHYYYLSDDRGYVTCDLIKSGSIIPIRVNLMLDVSIDKPRIEGAIPIAKSGVVGKVSYGVYPGDKLNLLYESNSYYTDAITVTSDLAIGDAYLDYEEMYVSYRIKDINGNYHFTEELEIQ